MAILYPLETQSRYTFLDVIASKVSLTGDHRARAIKVERKEVIPTTPEEVEISDRTRAKCNIPCALIDNMPRSSNSQPNICSMQHMPHYPLAPVYRNETIED